jgi:hypothetical protein
MPFLTRKAPLKTLKLRVKVDKDGTSSYEVLKTAALPDATPDGAGEAWQGRRHAVLTYGGAQEDTVAEYTYGDLKSMNKDVRALKRGIQIQGQQDKWYAPIRVTELDGSTVTVMRGTLIGLANRIFLGIFLAELLPIVFEAAFEKNFVRAGMLVGLLAVLGALTYGVAYAASACKRARRGHSNRYYGAFDRWQAKRRPCSEWLCVLQLLGTGGEGLITGEGLCFLGNPSSLSDRALVTRGYIREELLRVGLFIVSDRACNMRTGKTYNVERGGEFVHFVEAGLLLPGQQMEGVASSGGIVGAGHLRRRGGLAFPRLCNGDAAYDFIGRQTENKLGP